MFKAYFLVPIIEVPSIHKGKEIYLFLFKCFLGFMLCIWINGTPLIWSSPFGTPVEEYAFLSLLWLYSPSYFYVPPSRLSGTSWAFPKPSFIIIFLSINYFENDFLSQLSSRRNELNPLSPSYPNIPLQNIYWIKIWHNLSGAPSIYCDNMYHK